MPTIHPAPDAFKRLARRFNVIPVFTDVVADQVTPVALVASRWARSRYCCLLESVEGGETLGRYSFAAFDPETVLMDQNGQTLELDARGRRVGTAPGLLLDEVEKRLAGVRAAAVPGVPRFFGGAVGYGSYELAHRFERLPKSNPDRLGWPEAAFQWTRDPFIFDNSQQLLKVVSCAVVKSPAHAASAYREAVRRIRKNLATLKHLRGRPAGPVRRSAGAGFSSDVAHGPFCAAVRKAKRHIGQGDIIQVVLSRRLEKRTSASPLDIYRCLRVVNPSPYMVLMKFGDRALIGSSPESLVRLENGVASTRPIAGTRPRGRTPEEDARLKAELLRDPKERAEHVMLVDLGRNDLGRVCEAGSVATPTFMTVERYSHVMHIVSEVTGRLQKGKNAFDLFRAAFPAGTVSGAPKIRAMEIIDDLEGSQRGPYAGALGYVSFSGNMDMAITIRTLLWDRGRVSVQAGAGIVADSVPEREFREAENKAAALLKTVRLAETGEMFLP